MLTGEKVVLAADILFDCGHSLNPAVDIGQARSPLIPNPIPTLTSSLHIDISLTSRAALRPTVTLTRTRTPDPDVNLARKGILLPATRIQLFLPHRLQWCIQLPCRRCNDSKYITACESQHALRSNSDCAPALPRR